MIVLLVLGLILLAAVGYRYYRHLQLRKGFIVLGTLLTLIGTVGYVRALTSNYGLTKQSVSRTQTIKPATEIAGLSFITTVKSDSKTNVRYTYMIGDKTYQTLSEGTKTTVKEVSGTQATLKTVLNEYRAKTLYQQFVRLGVTDLKSGTTVYTLSLPKNWYVVTTAQLTTLQKLQKSASDRIVADVPAEVTREMEAAAANDAAVLTDTNKQAEIQKAALATVTNRVNAELVQQLQAQLTQWNK
jgi:hypothetical protein